MTDNGPSGFFDSYRGWLLSTDGADDDGGMTTTSHEDHHRHLQNSTSFGLLTLALRFLADNGLASRVPTAAGLVAMSTRTQESFATWASVTSSNADRSSLLNNPEYLAHYDIADKLTDSVPAGYLRLHAVHAACRACMQTSEVSELLLRGLHVFDLNDIASPAQPDRRLRRLQRYAIDWSAATDAAHEILEASPIPHAAHQPLEAAFVDPRLSTTWNAINDIFYVCAATRLNELDAATLDLDGQIEIATELKAEVQRITGARFGFDVVQPNDAVSASLVAFQGVERQVLSIGEPMPCEVLRADELSNHVAALGDDAHLFVTLRTTAALRANYSGVFSDWSDADHWMLRRTIQHADSRHVELALLDDTGMSALAGQDIPVVALVPLSRLRERSEPPTNWITDVSRCVALLDVSLADHLPLWTAATGSVFNYCFLKTESFGRTVGILVCQVSGPAGATHLMIRGMHDAAVRTLTAGFDELAPEMHIEADPELVDRGGTTLMLAIAHLVGEERIFGIDNDSW